MGSIYHIKEDKRSKDAADRIYNALSREMEKKIFQKITVSAVVEEAQVARSTFYRNFDDLSDVLRYKCDLTIEALLAHLIISYQRNKAEQAQLFEDDEYFIAVRSGMIMGLLIQWIRNGKDKSPDELEALILKQTLVSLDMDLVGGKWKK